MMIILYFIYFNIAIGFCCAMWFSFFKAKKIDGEAAHTSFWFKIIIIPAVILLWPLVLVVVWNNKKNEINSHEK